MKFIDIANIVSSGAHIISYFSEPSPCSCISLIGMHVYNKLHLEFVHGVQGGFLTNGVIWKFIFCKLYTAIV